MMILVSTLLGMDNNMIPRQLPHWEMSTFLGSFTKYPSFQSAGACSCSHIFTKRGLLLLPYLD
ncbi:hypothetical protein DPMN_179220 [Dreissena polymorpha]|uniref:Uncharacterized protein n=1 Tax=Dreissena polymorpha TaxID=45954 RepID=A0A9D4IM53_DREPO|nr:hypothetical protein DPMN_179220 [Dreissena polymorpha]